VSTSPASHAGPAQYDEPGSLIGTKVAGQVNPSHDVLQQVSVLQPEPAHMIKSGLLSGAWPAGQVNEPHVASQHTALLAFFVTPCVPKAQGSVSFTIPSSGRGDFNL